MKRLAALALAAAALSVRAAVTNVVDVAALVAAADNNATTTTNGWTLSGLASYSASCVKFDTKGDWLASPDFGAPILRIEAKVRCSSTVPTRWLYVLCGETTLTNFAACATKDKLEPQTLVFPADSSVSCVRFKLDGSSTTGVWGIGEMKVVTAEPIYVPTNLRMVRAGGDWCSLSWENGANTVSNRVDAFVVDRSAAGEKVLFETGFDEFVGNDKANKKVSDEELARWLGDSFSGTNVYALAATNGICYLGQTRSLGILRHSGFDDYGGMKLRMSAKRYDSNPETMIVYEYGGNTNRIETLVLADEFENHEVDLSSVPGGAAILIGYYETSSNRRILIDSLSFVRSGEVMEMPAGTRWIPAASGAAMFSTKGEFDLPADAECRFEVRAVNADGLVSGAAELAVRLEDRPGACLMLR